MMPGKKEYHIDGQTRGALQANTGVRFLLRAKLTLESRHSSDIIPWAQSLAEKITKAVVETAGHDLAHFVMHLNVIRLLSHRPYAFICYDVFLNECDGQARNQFSQSPQQPIHEIIKRGNSCHVIRSKRMDDTVAAQYGRMQEVDNGPRPYFADSRYPPLYVDGRRVERSKDGKPDPDEPEGWDWERGLVFQPEEDELNGDESKEDELEEDELKEDEEDELKGNEVKGGELKRNDGE
ncbi:uncharacterized protein B0H64DRAFT_408663 [Chaetomium fimeti]|uniref:Uncharacterized protein n=1 Tax=Chaetomium fimeti TaxID=1854472 RepID=A0AAE0H8T7_9PEZI|nr:hypothetical protein B0H64DRAFT_408663 [Chaetomium fimeti]